MAAAVSLAQARAQKTTETAFDSWHRVGNAEVPQEERDDLLELLRTHQAAQGGEMTEEAHLLALLAAEGPATPLAALATKLYDGLELAPRTKLNRTRELVRRLWAKRMLVQRKVRVPPERCTHAETKHDCDRARRAHARETRNKVTCVAHQGYYERWILKVPPEVFLRRFETPETVVAARLAMAKRNQDARNRALGIDVNDFAARRRQGKPIGRGPKGTNRTSERGAAYLARIGASHGGARTPVPVRDPSDLKTHAYLEGDRGIDPASPCNGSSADAPSAPESAGHATEPTPPPSSPSVLHESCGEEDGEKIVPERQSEIRFAQSRDPRELVRRRRDANWVLAQWKAWKLPPMTTREIRECLWARTKHREYSDDGVVRSAGFEWADLALLLERAKRRAPYDGRATFRRSIGARAELASKYVAEERERAIVLPGGPIGRTSRAWGSAPPPIADAFGFAAADRETVVAQPIADRSRAAPPQTASERAREAQAAAELARFHAIDALQTKVAANEGRLGPEALANAQTQQRQARGAPPEALALLGALEAEERSRAERRRGPPLPRGFRLDPRLCTPHRPGEDGRCEQCGNDVAGEEGDDGS